MCSRRCPHEAYISTAQYPAQAGHGFSGTFAFRRRSSNSSQQKAQGPRTVGGLVKGVAFPFSRSLRLRSGWEFDLVFRTGRKIQGRLVRLFFVDAPDGITRVGVAVGKRQGGAVCRSRGKRVLREAFRHLLPLTKEGLWIVAMLRQSALGDSAARVYDDMRQVLFAEGLLRVSRMPVEWKVLRLSSRDSCEKCSGERR